MAWKASRRGRARRGLATCERVSGVLPPLTGVRKRIAGARGETRRPGPLRHPVHGRGRLTLRYKRAAHGLVDDARARRRRASAAARLFRGREYGRFVCARSQLTRGRRRSAGRQLERQLVKHIDEALAMEQNVLRMLDSMIATTDDREIKAELRAHKLETERQADRLRRRLEAHGATPSVVREAGGILGALMKSVVDVARGEKAGRNARDGYATEHMEIAAYQLLERVATRAGDEETAEVARRNRAEEEAMAKQARRALGSLRRALARREGTVESARRACSGDRGAVGVAASVATQPGREEALDLSAAPRPLELARTALPSTTTSVGIVSTPKRSTRSGRSCSSTT